MAKTIQTAIEAGSRMAPAKFYIKITPDGPYLLYGNPPMDQEIIVPNDEGSSGPIRRVTILVRQRSSRLYADSISKNKPIAMVPIITRTGDSGKETALSRFLIGRWKNMSQLAVLADNEEYCAFARFCDAYGRIWNLA